MGRPQSHLFEITVEIRRPNPWETYKQVAKHFGPVSNVSVDISTLRLLFAIFFHTNAHEVFLR